MTSRSTFKCTSRPNELDVNGCFSKAGIRMLLSIKNIATGILSDPADVTRFLMTALRAVVNLGHYCFLNSQFSSCDEPGLKRSASYPLIHSESFQLATTEGEHANQRNDNHVLRADSSDAIPIMVFLPHRPRNAAHRGHAEPVYDQQKGAIRGHYLHINARRPQPIYSR